RAGFQGKIPTDVRVAAAPPVFASFQSGSYRADKAESGSSAAPVTPLQVDMAGANIRSVPEQKFQEAKQAVDLTQAPLIVAVGRGVKGRGKPALGEKTAATLGRVLRAH